jgi:hypothetical protein
VWCACLRPYLQEVFLQELAVRAHAVMLQDSSRKGLEYRDLGEEHTRLCRHAGSCLSVAA